MINRHRLSSPSEYRRKTLSTYNCIVRFTSRMLRVCTFVLRPGQSDWWLLAFHAGLFHSESQSECLAQTGGSLLYQENESSTCIQYSNTAYSLYRHDNTFTTGQVIANCLEMVIVKHILSLSYLSYGVHRTNTIILALNIARSIDLENYTNWVYCTGIPKRRHHFRSNVTSSRSRRFPTSVHVVVQKIWTI